MFFQEKKTNQNTHQNGDLVVQKKKAGAESKYLQDNRPSSKTSRNAEKKEQKNMTGLPAQLKAGIENLSGLSMDDVKVNFNSSKPAQFNALAYAQGNQIHISPSQEKYLPHEAWHVVQQKQGRVKPTIQLKNNVHINTDTYLEKEADIMGQRSLSTTPSNAKQDLAETSIGGALVQRFADERNATRRNSVQIATGELMQLDHAIPQDTIRHFYDLLPSIHSINSELRPPEVVRFRDISNEIFNMQEITVQEVNAFLNLRNNLTVGFRNTTGNPGNRFDPQIEIRGDDVIETQQSEALEIIDRHMRSVISKGNIIKGINNLREESIENFLMELKSDFASIIDALNLIKNHGSVPGFNPHHWYDFKGSKVKKVSATYLQGDNGLLKGLGTKKAVNRPQLWIRRALHISLRNIHGQGTKRTLETKQLNVIVNITVPPEAWKHIYERHTIEYFAWDVQAINTFWKEDPFVLFMNYENEIAASLLLLIDRQNDIEAYVNSVKDNGEEIMEEGNINEPAGGFFYQGSYSYEERVPRHANVRPWVTLNITLASFAPQNPEMAFAVLPDILDAKRRAALDAE